jgi:hypothetical protein
MYPAAEVAAGRKENEVSSRSFEKTDACANPSEKTVPRDRLLA